MQSFVDILEVFSPGGQCLAALSLDNLPTHLSRQLKLTDGDAAFLLGKGGKTKMKIARVSGADLEMCAGLPPQRTFVIAHDFSMKFCDFHKFSMKILDFS